MRNGPDDEVITCEFPRWMLRHMRGNARHSQHTAKTHEGEKDAERIVTHIDYYLNQETDTETMTHEEHLTDGDESTDDWQFEEGDHIVESHPMAAPGGIELDPATYEINKRLIDEDGRRYYYVLGSNGKVLNSANSMELNYEAVDDE